MPYNDSICRAIIPCRVSPGSMKWRGLICFSVSSRTRPCPAMASTTSDASQSAQKISMDNSSESDGARPLHTTCEALQADQGSPTSSQIGGIPAELPSKSRVRRMIEGREFAKFRLTDSCLLALHRGDITKWSVDGQTDAIVNAANTRMLGGGGVDGAIHRAAGPDLYDACLKLPLVGKNIRCRTGDAVITEGFRLPVSKIVHTVGPVYEDDEESGPLLESSYKSSLVLADKSGVKYLAFPAISCGIYGYPYDKAAEIALNTVSKHLAGLKEVHFVLFEEGSWVEWLEKACKSFERLEKES
ncbi:hypothetical protein L7F22_009486 [Adiantum nelumboides]|nr:hypothetical protein [Adiantum nelumboides]